MKNRFTPNLLLLATLLSANATAGQNVNLDEMRLPLKMPSQSNLTETPSHSNQPGRLNQMRVDHFQIRYSRQQVQSFDTKTNSVLWTIVSKVGLFEPVVHSSTVYITGQDGNVTALALGSGKTRWQRNLSDGWIYPPVFSADVLVTVGQESSAWGIDAATGKTLWHKKLSQEPVYRPVKSGDEVVLTLFSGEIISLNGWDGTIYWSRTFATPSFSPSADGKHLYVASYGNRMKALAVGDGRTIWDVAVPGRIDKPALILGDRLFAVTDERQLLEIDTVNGRLISVHSLPGEAMTPPSLNQGNLLVWVSRGNNLPPVPVSIAVQESKPIKEDERS